MLPYPFVLLANVMSIAAPGQTAIGAIPFILLCGYPVVWIALYVFSWRAMASGAVGLAFGLPSIPALSIVAFLGLWAAGWASAGKFDKTAENDLHEKFEANPLVWTIWRAGGRKKFPFAGTLTVDEALREVEANPTRINIAVPEYGTPLRMAVMNLSIDPDGTPKDETSYRDMVRLVRALVSRGAHFGPNEDADLDLQWRLKRALHDGPVSTASENPLVWKILTKKMARESFFLLEKDDLPLLNKTTQLHGTPLHAAMLVRMEGLYSELIEAGARLSEAEERDSASAAALGRMLEFNPALRQAYTKPR
jgi:hypothetical protein